MLRRLEKLVEDESSPSQDADLKCMTSMLQLAVGARTMLREEEYSLPKPADHLISTFYPILSTYILEVQLRDADETDGILPCPGFPNPKIFQIERSNIWYWIIIPFSSCCF